MIKKITKDNIKSCIEVFIKAYNQPPWNFNWTQEKAEQYLSEYVGSPQFVGYILYDKNEAVGAFLSHKRTWWTTQQLVIDEFFISPDKQKMGFGKSLMEFCNGYAKENEIEILFLMTNKYMPAYKFYNKFGFVDADQYTYMFKQVI